MEMRQSILYFVIFFGFGFIFAYILLGYPIFVDILKLIVAGITASLTIQSIKIYKERKEKRLAHSKLLLDNNPEGRTKTRISFELDNTLDLIVKSTNPDTFIDMTPQYETKTNYYSFTPLPPPKKWYYPLQSQIYERYSTEIDAHLNSGYFKEVWEHGTERDKFINEHNAVAKEFLKDITERIISEIKKTNPSLKEWDGNIQNGNIQPIDYFHSRYLSDIKKRNPSLKEWDENIQPIKYFHPRYFSNDICPIVQNSYYEIFDINKYYVIKFERNKWILTTKHALAESNNENEIQEIKKIIITSLNGAFAGENFKALKKYYQDIKEKHALYLNGISKINKDLENGFPLKGHCKICQKFPLL